MSPRSYGDYLKLSQLLSSQSPITDEHDEMQFIVVHQVFELWFSLILFEIKAIFSSLEQGEVRSATRTLKRIDKITAIFPHYLQVLGTMRPQDFHLFRGALEGASGLQSEQFREVELVSGLGEESAYVEGLRKSGHWTEKLKKRVQDDSLRLATRRLIEKEGVSLEEIYAHPDDHEETHDFLEACLDYDERMQEWRSAHLRLAERMIGSGALGTGGMGAPYLRGTLRFRFFPDLWKVRDQVTVSGGGKLAGPASGGEKR
ncbi:MAG: tryptophan 2,3-dioxygenase family protein [Planctomycetota bacterium]|nr:tryptophan 2,3-dioxygenase family protein [Planctomycetota bacterium]